MDFADAETTAAPAAPVGKPNLTPREQEVLMAAWLSIKGDDPKLDYDVLAKLIGSKNAHSANTCFYMVKKKTKQFRSANGEGSEGSEGSEAPLPASPSTTPTKAKKPATPRKRAARDPATPKSAKTKRAKMEPAAKLVKEEKSDEDVADETDRGEA